MKDTIAFVKSLLYQYRHNVSELNELSKAKESLEEQLRYYNRELKETKDEIIESLSLQGVQLSHIPHSVTNKFNSKTENVALNYSDDKADICDLTEIANAYISAKLRIKELEADISLTDNMVNCLNDKKKFIIKNKYVNGYTLPEVMIYYNETFPIKKEIATINFMKQEAEKEMAIFFTKRINR